MSIADRLNAPQPAQAQTLPALLKQNGARLQTIAPQGVDINRFSAALMTAVRSTPKLAECSPMSILGAFIQSTQLGLEPGAALGQCYFVPYKGEATLQIGYRGQIELAYRSGRVTSIAARCVYQNDSFVYEFGLIDKLEHKPAVGVRGALVAVYAIAKLVNGGVHFEVLDVTDIEKARKSSKTGSFGPWKDFYDEMAKKTAIRRLFKYLPVGTDLNRAAALDEHSEAGISDTAAVAESVIDGDYQVLNGGGVHDTQ
ncbi:recombinase RecT [Methylobacter sp. G7]|uniref:recombinase RecT n=1 Tax=Methylobacter sp. G7 TaxID=3230117 RepID=UPI003D80A294